MKNLLKNVLLAKYTTTQVGGLARYFIEVKKEKELIEAVKYAKSKGFDYLVIGEGSNLLISDSGFDGLIIKNNLSRIDIKGELVKVGSGTKLRELIHSTVTLSLSGMEKLAGIPGTVGGAICGNAGGYGSTISDHVTRVKVFDGNKIFWTDKKDCKFSYRESIFKKNKFMILEAEFKLKKSNYKDVKKLAGETINKRIKKYNSNLKCPGSFFKNVLVDDLTADQLTKISKEKIVYGKVPAGYFLEAVGAKGMKCGKIIVAPFHANFFLNTDGGTAKDYYHLAMELKNKVMEKFGVELESEVQFVGFGKSFRQIYPEFIYEKYSWRVEGNNLVINFNFSIPPKIGFKPSLVIKNIPKERFDQIDKNVFDQFVFNLGLVEIPSYWKSTCSPKIVVNAGYLDKYQLNWWKDLILNGMGQFFYENDIDFTSKDFISIKSTGKKVNFVPVAAKGEGVLIPVGGGKDSVVTLELLMKTLKIGTFVINPTKASLDVIRESGTKEVVEVERIIDGRLLKLNSRGFLNGHTPFSAVVAFLSTFSAFLFAYKDVALSNERSSDEENLTYLNRKINHQYSKTFDFENKFREYSKRYLSGVNYFSFLRPLYEIQIAKIFSEMDKYFGLIKSCNVGQKTNTWCGNCPKCLSTYILLLPFLGKDRLKQIFREDLLIKQELKPILKSLISKDEVKPFECVGTRDELQSALMGSFDDILNSWGPNNLDHKYERVLKEAL